MLAQWSFLGSPQISNSPVGNQSIAISADWVPHIAYTSNGSIFVKRFDGHQWLDLSTNGLPANSITDCALAFLPDGSLCMAVAPTLGCYRLDSLGWQPMPGLPAVQDIQGLEMRVAADGRLWISGFLAGPTDSTFLFSKPMQGNWAAKGVLPGRLVDMELDDLGEPLLLLASSNTILHFVNGTWQALPPFTVSNETYFDFQMLYDGSGIGLLVARRDTLNGLTVEQLSLGTWTQLGTAGFATGDIAALALDHSGTPCVAVVDHVAAGPPKAYQLIAGSWQFWGGQFVYNNTVSQPRWAFDPGAAYLLFRDDEDNLRNSVVYLGIPNAMDTMQQLQSLQLGPNPAEDLLHLEVPATKENSTLTIRDFTGRIVSVQSRLRAGSNDLSISHLPSGRYAVTLEIPQHPPIRGTFTKLQ